MDHLEEIEALFQIVPGLCMYLVPLPRGLSFVYRTLKRTGTVSN